MNKQTFKTRSTRPKPTIVILAARQMVHATLSTVLPAADHCVLLTKALSVVGVLDVQLKGCREFLCLTIKGRTDFELQVEVSCAG